MNSFQITVSVNEEKSRSPVTLFKASTFAHAIKEAVQAELAHYYRQRIRCVTVICDRLENPAILKAGSGEGPST